MFLQKQMRAYSVFSHRTLERRAPHCPADELDISQSLLKALESESDSPPWPSLHVNMDKVRPTPGMLLSNSAHLFETFNFYRLLLWQGEEKQLSEKSLHPPASPVTLPDHLKCNILKAQMEAAFRVSTTVHFPHTVSLVCRTVSLTAVSSFSFIP